MNKRILITGAGGFVGKHLIQTVKDHDKSEIFVSINSRAGEIGKFLPEDHILKVDLTSQEQAANLIKTVAPDIVYHLASLSVVHSSSAEAAKILTNNILLQYNILESIRLYAPSSRVVVISSGNVYGNAQNDSSMDENTPLRPMNPYAVSKLNQEFLSLQYHLAYNLDIVILRPFNHTGKGQTTDFIVPLLASQFAAIKKGQIPNVIEVGNLDSQRDFTDVQDICRGYIMAAEQGVSGQVYNLGSGAGVSVKQIISIFEELTGEKVEVKIDPSRIRGGDVNALICNSAKFRNLTGWKPTINLRDTLESVLDYYMTLN